MDFSQNVLHRCRAVGPKPFPSGGQYGNLMVDHEPKANTYYVKTENVRVL